MDTEILSHLVITEVCSVSTMYTPENLRMKRKNRPHWAIVLKYEGETIYYANGQHWRSDANHMVILPKGCSYEWQCVRAGHFSIIEFDSEPTSTELFGMPVKNSEQMLRLFRDLEYKRTLKKPLIELESIMDTYFILLRLVQAQSPGYLPTQKQKKIEPALDYIAKHYSSKIKNDELAALTGLSTVYFRKLFVEVMGQPPISYIQMLRIQKAKEMLQSDYSSISDIALALGYQNIYDFSRSFKKQVGLSPGQYRKRENLSTRV